MLHKVAFGLAYVGLFALAFWLESGAPLPSRSSGSCIGSEESYDQLNSGWYDRLTHAGYQDDGDSGGDQFHFVTLVAIERGTEPSFIVDNICPQRLFLASLLSEIEKQTPSSIVVDKFFSASSCPKNDPGTVQLHKVLAGATVPIILGLQTDDTPRGNGSAGACLGLAPNSLFDPAHPPSDKVLFGLTRLNRDTRKIPLDWPLLNAPKMSAVYQRHGAIDGLALTAAEQYRPGLSAMGTPLSQLLGRHIHPFAQFPSTQVKPIPASQILCGKALGESGIWQKCAAPKDPSWAADLNNHIVVVGQFSPSDVHDTTMGPMTPGVVLQASYIEALLRDRKYFKPVSDYVSMMVLAGWIGVLFFLFWWLESPEMAALVSLGILAVLWFASWLLLLEFDYLLTFTIGAASFIAVAIKWIEVRGHMMHAHKQREHTQKQASTA